MGAGQSKPPVPQQVTGGETPIEFSQGLFNALAGKLAEEQNRLDPRALHRIEAGLQQTEDDKEHIQRAIEAALEAENLGAERSMAGEGNGGIGNIKSSAVLLGDLQSIQVDDYKWRKFPEVDGKAKAVVTCYKSHPTTPLNCWREVREFKASVLRAELARMQEL